MDQDLKKIKKLVAFMRKEGVLTLKQGDIELSLAQMALHPEQKEQLKESDKEDKPLYTDEDVLFWSSPGSLPEDAH